MKSSLLSDYLKTWVSLSVLWTPSNAFYAAVSQNMRSYQPQMSLHMSLQVFQKTSQVFQTVSRRVRGPFAKQAAAVPAAAPAALEADERRDVSPEREPRRRARKDEDLLFQDEDDVLLGEAPRRRGQYAPKQEGIGSAARWLSHTFTDIVASVSHDNAEPDAMIITKGVKSRYPQHLPIVIMERDQVVVLRNGNHG